MARRYKHSLAEIKAMILQSAETIVNEQGYSALNARKIALDIDYTVGSIYMVFDSMADIALHINAKTLSQLASYMAKSQDKTLSIDILTQSYFNYATTHFNRWRMLFEYRLAENLSLPEWYRLQIEQNFAAIEILFLKTLPEDTELDCKLVAKMLWASLHGIFALSASNILRTINVNEMEAIRKMWLDNFASSWLSTAKKN
ncbi:TetR/AcrR family transcriptional regulator [Crenothrix sp.]|uniref:TetR/AcrR family transcriptional regulator n=1 Tax=Crenothrix sp. TaxID=3100433 RepID=UPI00374CF541